MNLKELENPYFEDVFIEPTKEEWEQIERVVGALGCPLDKISGSLCRIGWNNAVRSIKEEIKLKIECIEFEKEGLSVTGKTIKGIRIDELKKLLGD